MRLLAISFITSVGALLLADTFWTEKGIVVGAATVNRAEKSNWNGALHRSDASPDSDIIVSTEQQSQGDLAEMLQCVQNTLERVKPWAMGIEKEAKRIGNDVINGLGYFMDTLIGGGERVGYATDSMLHNILKATTTTKTTNATAATATATSTKAPGVDRSTTTDPAAAVAAANSNETMENQILLEMHKQHTNCPKGFKANVHGVCQRVQ